MKKEYKNFKEQRKDILKQIKERKEKEIERHKITFEEHKLIGMIIKILSDKLMKSTEGYRTVRQSRKCYETKAYKILNEFKNLMKEIMMKDYKIFDDLNFYQGSRNSDLDIIKAIKEKLESDEKCLN